MPGRSAFAGEVRGLDAVRRYLEAAIAHAQESKVEVELVEMLVGDERVALIVKERFPRPEGAVEIRRANVYRVRDERIDEVPYLLPPRLRRWSSITLRPRSA